jgi:protein-tyrosine kinase
MTMTPGMPRWNAAGDTNWPAMVPLGGTPGGVSDKGPAAGRERFVFPAIPSPYGESAEEGTAGSTAIWPSCDCTETARACAALARTIGGRLRPGRPAVLAITSPGEGDGKTSLLTALAPALARRMPGGVLAVDADYHKPDLTARLTLTAEQLTADMAPVYPTNLAGLSVLPMGPGRRSGSDLEWIGPLRATWPLVLLDTAPLTHARTASMVRYCDAVCLVVRLGHTLQRAVAESARVIQRNGGRLLGCVVVGGEEGIGD